MKRTRTLGAVVFLFSALPLMAGAELRLANSKSVPNPVKVDQQFVVSFDLVSAGNVGVSGAKASVTLPAGSSFVAAGTTSSSPNWTCAVSGGPVVCQPAPGALAVLGPTGSPNPSVTFGVAFKAPTSASSTTVTIKADPDNAIAEDNEGNNQATVSVTYTDTPRVGVVSNICQSPKLINSHYVASFVLKNIGTLDVRYPGLKITIDGGGTPVKFSKVEGGSAIGITAGATANTHTFTWVPGADNTPLKAGSNAQGQIYMWSGKPQTVKVTAEIDTQAIQDSSPADNKAECVIQVNQQ